MGIREGETPSRISIFKKFCVNLHSKTKRDNTTRGPAAHETNEDNQTLHPANKNGATPQLPDLQPIAKIGRTKSVSPHGMAVRPGRPAIPRQSPLATMIRAKPAQTQALLPSPGSL